MSKNSQLYDGLTIADQDTGTCRDFHKLLLKIAELSCILR